MEGRAEGRRGRGRPMTSWIGKLKEWSRKSAVELTKISGNDRTEWRNPCIGRANRKCKCQREGEKGADLKKF